MVSLFKDRSPVTIFWLLILSIIVHSHFFVFPPVAGKATSDGLISIFINNYLVLFSTSLIIFTYHTVIILQALRLNHLFTDQRMFSRVNYLPAMTYILFTGLFTEWSSLTSALLSNTFVIWLFALLVRLQGKPNPKTLLFNIGLLAGVSTISYHPLALLLPVAFFALMILRPFIITEWLVLLMGFVTPYYFLFCYLYLNDKIAAIKNFLPAWWFNLPRVHISVYFFATIAVIVLALFLGFYFWRAENRKLLIQIRNNWLVLIVMLLILLPAPFINKNAGIESAILYIVPASPIIARGLLAPGKNILPALMFWLFLILAILKSWQIIR